MVVDDGGLVRPGVRRRAAGGLVDTVECHLAGQRLRGAQGEPGVVGAHRDLLIRQLDSGFLSRRGRAI
jgi:hypothetical protein